ncbi:hypothetical protein GCM10010869_02850 [Mesorhizobium tianshanense]|uniref:Type III secretion system (T3SS) inner membrane Yop/YscD-like protein n=1 Tax=Mesorhizobium tianshanense TaxID=39844 RepID=A0A562PC13_9HYPH|nr:EscD/YscD/HrpQ family type III secretion system periplasmic domain-containing protein [Mesorhizobium tianshanense]TWI41977.1 type III secretion system (T3SS) inner membrane Yop/YscD-like protein [Mesorhizobium tianshanense]GLS34697.1 hypothetical protein GCM10010869_02850 [Mesorhizobium tianshanense]
MTAKSTLGQWNAALPQLFAERTDRQPATQPAILEIVGGLHSGAKVELDGLLYTIGSSVGSGIVLRDSGIAAEHARLRRKAGFVEVEAVGGDVVLANGDVVPIGHGRRCKLPFEASFGEARLKLTGPTQTEVPSQLAWRSWLVAAGLLAVASTAVVAANNLSVAGPEMARSDVGLTKVALADGIQQYALTDASHADSEPPATADDASRQLELQLEQAGIDGLAIEQAAGRLTVSGTIPAPQLQAWTDVQSWFDRTYGEHLLLASDVTTGNADTRAPRLTMQAIWYGERPYIITTDGARYHEGAFTDDGWAIESIGEKQLLLTKGGAKVALKYQ